MADSDIQDIKLCISSLAICMTQILNILTVSAVDQNAINTYLRETKLMVEDALRLILPLCQEPPEPESESAAPSGPMQ